MEEFCLILSLGSSVTLIRTRGQIFDIMSTLIVGSMESPSKVFLLFFLLPDWLKLNHLKSRMECGFSDIFSRHFCSTVAKTIGLTNYAASFGAKKCSENHIWSCWDDSRSMEPTIKTQTVLRFIDNWIEMTISWEVSPTTILMTNFNNSEKILWSLECEN